MRPGTVPLPRFVVLTALGSLAGNLLLVGAGYQLGRHWEDVSDVVGGYSKVVLGVAVIALVGGAAALVRARRRRS